MALTVTTQTCPEYLKVVVAGDWSLDGILKVIESLKAEADRAERSRLLVDLRGMEGNPQVVERYDAGRHIAMFLLEYRMAVVAQAKHITHFAELVANNRGATMAVFISKEEAISWLIRE